MANQMISRKRGRGGWNLLTPRNMMVRSIFVIHVFFCFVFCLLFLLLYSNFFVLFYCCSFVFSLVFWWTTTCVDMHVHVCSSRSRMQSWLWDRKMTSWSFGLLTRNVCASYIVTSWDSHALTVIQLRYMCLHMLPVLAGMTMGYSRSSQKKSTSSRLL